MQSDYSLDMLAMRYYHLSIIIILVCGPPSRLSPLECLLRKCLK